MNDGHTNYDELAHLRQQVEELRRDRDRYRLAISDAIEAMMHTEINPRNYDHDDVCNLNDSCNEAHGILGRALTPGPTKGATHDH